MRMDVLALRPEVLAFLVVAVFMAFLLLAFVTIRAVGAVLRGIRVPSSSKQVHQWVRVEPRLNEADLPHLEEVVTGARVVSQGICISAAAD